MTKYGQTDRFTTGKFLSELEKYAGEGVIDYCLANKSKDFGKIPVTCWAQGLTYQKRNNESCCSCESLAKNLKNGVFKAKLFK